MRHIKIISCLLLVLSISQIGISQTKRVPLRMAVAGIAHGHNAWLLNRIHDSIMEIVGIYEPNTDLADKMAKKYKIDQALF
jgi:hypothetical protein